jgi:AhpD family alkylhydroperoxidase
MEARMTNPATILEAGPAIQALYKSVYNGGAPQAVLGLVHLRASQINGCSPCVDAGVKGMRKLGESDERIGLVAAWREAPYYTDEERAALAFTEAATRMADKSDAVPDEVWDAAAQFFDEKQLAAIVLMAAVTNLFNRLNGPTRQVAGAAW